MKKRIAVLLSFLLFIPLVACSARNLSTEGSVEKTEEKLSAQSSEWHPSSTTDKRQSQEAPTGSSVTVSSSEATPAFSTEKPRQTLPPGSTERYNNGKPTAKPTKAPAETRPAATYTVKPTAAPSIKPTQPVPTAKPTTTTTGNPATSASAPAVTVKPTTTAAPWSTATSTAPTTTVPYSTVIPTTVPTVTQPPATTIPAVTTPLSTTPDSTVWSPPIILI